MRGPGCRCQQRGRIGVPHLGTFRCLVCGQLVDGAGSFVCPAYRPDTGGRCATCGGPAEAHTYAAQALGEPPEAP